MINRYNKKIINNSKKDIKKPKKKRKVKTLYDLLVKMGIVEDIKNFKK